MAIFDALSQHLGADEAFARVVLPSWVDSINVRGRWGVVQSSPQDRCVLPHYGCAGDWATTTHTIISTFFGEGGGTYIDIGANIGLTTLPIARNPNVRCFAFEPEPTNFANLCANVRRNVTHGNVVVHQLALMDRVGTVPFGLSDEGNLGDHRVLAQRDKTRLTIDVEAVPLDSLNLPLEGPLAVKIDTQGAEPFIVAGGQAVLAKADVVVMEFCPAMIAQLGGNPEVVLDYLSGFGRVALLAGDCDGALSFRPAAEICDFLRQAFAQACHDETRYWDIYAYRAP